MTTSFLPPVIDWPPLIALLTRLAVDLFSTLAVVRAYARRHPSHEFVFTYYVFNAITCLLCLLLRQVSSPVGFGLALFGIFGILRYRTEQVRVRELTYLFVVIGIGVVNGVADAGVSLVELLVVNGVIIALCAWHELRPAGDRVATTTMMYDQLHLLMPENRASLVADVRARTGLNVLRVDIGRLDLLRDCAEIAVVHRDA